MRQGPCPGFPSCALCLPTRGLSHLIRPGQQLPLPAPTPHRYGGFSLGGRDTGLPSGHEVGRSLEELRVLLSPQSGGALDRVLNNLTKWAHGLDAQDSLKVEMR